MTESTVKVNRVYSKLEVEGTVVTYGLSIGTNISDLARTTLNGVMTADARYL